MYKLDEFMAELERKNPAQPEFIQAAREALQPPPHSTKRQTSFSIFSNMYDPRFLPICKEDLDELGWDYVDVIIVSADAYVDHPCFGHAVVGRLFEHEGLRVAILPQPNWRDDLRDFKKLGRPRMFFAISSGMDSMVPMMGWQGESLSWV